MSTSRTFDLRRTLLTLAGLALGAALLLAASAVPTASAGVDGVKRYIVVFDASKRADGTYALSATGAQKALALVASAGGVVTADLTLQAAVAIVRSADAQFAETVSQSPLVELVGDDFAWKAMPTLAEAVDRGDVQLVTAADNPEPSSDPLESLQWDMQLIRTEQAHATQAGSSAVDVGILDSGVDATHLDFIDPASGVTNVDCIRARDFVIGVGPGVGTPAPCSDNLFHGTHVAGSVAARANGHGIVGVAPNVTLVPIKTCDVPGYCYAGSAVAAIAYAGSLKLEVINMSFFVDDDEFQASTEVKCKSDPTQWAFRTAVDRAIQYAISQGVTPVAAAGNSDRDLSPSALGAGCDVVPATLPGVIATVALGNQSEKAYYSSYGNKRADVSAPGGNFEDTSNLEDFCAEQVTSTIPGNVWACFQGTSMASPHAAGVAALIASQFGTVGSDGDVVISPTKVASILQKTAIDIGKSGYDKCFGYGRIDALRAVTNKQAPLADRTAPFCPEYDE